MDKKYDYIYNIICILILIVTIFVLGFKLSKSIVYDDLLCKPELEKDNKLVSSYYDSSFGCVYLQCEEGYTRFEKILKYGKCYEISFMNLKVIIDTKETFEREKWDVK